MPIVYYYYCRHHGRYTRGCAGMFFKDARSPFTFNPFSIVNERRVVARVGEHDTNVYSSSVCRTPKYTYENRAVIGAFFFFLIGLSTIVHGRLNVIANPGISHYTSLYVVKNGRGFLSRKTTTRRRVTHTHTAPAARNGVVRTIPG